MKVTGSTVDMPFLHRPPNDREMEHLRLLLSTYQDGTGMLMVSGSTLPGWRDFERSCASVFKGKATEDKRFIDVEMGHESESQVLYGIDCKMRRELWAAERRGRITVEVTNASGYLSKGLVETDDPNLVGSSLLKSIEDMKFKSSATYKPPINIADCYYFVLLWSKDARYRAYQLPLSLPMYPDLAWSKDSKEGKERLVGLREEKVVYEWYPKSGGQFKYYPHVNEAIWASDTFTLEPLPDSFHDGIANKAQLYFPEQWENLLRD